MNTFQEQTEKAMDELGLALKVAIRDFLEATDHSMIPIMEFGYMDVSAIGAVAYEPTVTIMVKIKREM